MNDQVIKVNLIPNTGTPAVAKVSQYDVGRPLQFVILDGATRATLAAGTRVYIKGTKPSGLGFSVYKILGAGGSTIAFQTNLAMTQECGRIPCELRVVDGDDDIGTANFILAVEKTPHAEGTTDGTQETMQNLETRLQAEIDGLDDRIEALENAEESGLTEAIKSAMLQIARKVAYIDEHGQTYYDALYDALYPPANLVSISAVYTPSGTVYESDSLDSLKSRLVVTAHWSNGTTSEVASANYTLSGTLTMGTSTVTVSYGGMTTTFEVTVVGLTGITATYTQSGTVYDTDTLDSLKSDLVVTANYSDGTSTTVTDYTLSGTLTEGTSTVTVAYGGKTATFDVTVTQEPPYTFYDYIQGDGTAFIDTGLKAQIYLDSNYEHELKVAHGVNESDKPIYGARQAWGNANARIVWQKNLSFNIAYCGSATEHITATTSESLYDPVTIKTGTDKKVYFNGIEVADYSSGSSGSITKTFNFTLFTHMNGQAGTGYISYDDGYVSPPSAVRFYHFKVRNSSNELIADMRPAMRKSDNAVGMYDLVRDEFFQNARDTGTFTLGNE